MFGIGMGEMILIATIGILILGPKRCIDLFRQAGKMWRNVRAEIASAKESLEE